MRVRCVTNEISDLPADSIVARQKSLRYIGHLPQFLLYLHLPYMHTPF